MHATSIRAQSLKKTGCVTQDESKEGQAGTKTKPRDSRCQESGISTTKAAKGNITAKVSDQMQRREAAKGRAGEQIVLRSGENSLAMPPSHPENN